MKFKVGDKVRVRKDLRANTFYSGVWFSNAMGFYRDKIITIERISKYHDREVYHSQNWNWGADMLEPVEDEKNIIKFCPDLTTKEEVKAILIGSGDYTRPLLHACIKEKCVAYKNGMCMKYDTEVE